MIQPSDIIPEQSEIEVRGVKYKVKPQKLYHALMITKFGSTFENIAKLTAQQAKQLDNEVNQLINELVPELASTELTPTEIMEVLAHIMFSSQPSEVKELQDEGIAVNNDPKAEVAG